MAQESRLSVGITGGLNIPKLSASDDNELSRDYSSRTGEAFGLTASYSLGKNLAIRADLLYSSEGGKRNGFQAMPNPDPATQGMMPYLYATFDNESVLNYLELPLMVQYSYPVSTSLRLYVQAGPYAGYLLNAKQKTRGSSIIYADRTQQIPISVVGETVIAVPLDANTDIEDQIHSLNIGLTGGLGLGMDMGPGEIMLDIRGAYGLTRIQKDAANGKSHIGNLLLALGYTIPL
jgi:hypothetical protein